jgi:hypothetical protein
MSKVIRLAMNKLKITGASQSNHRSAAVLSPNNRPLLDAVRSRSVAGADMMLSSKYGPLLSLFSDRALQRFASFGFHHCPEPRSIEIQANLHFSLKFGCGVSSTAA